MNEPAGNSNTAAIPPGMNLTHEESANMWYDTHNHIIKAIRDAGAENIIVLDEHFWGQGGYNSGEPDGPGSAMLSKGPLLNSIYENLVYSFHPYNWQSYEYILSLIKDCHERGLAVIVGEYGAVPGDVVSHNATRSLFDAAIPNGAGRIHWAWSADRYHLTQTGEGGGYLIDITDGINKPTNLTWLGGLIWDDNRGALTFPTPDHPYSGIKK